MRGEQRADADAEAEAEAERRSSLRLVSRCLGRSLPGPTLVALREGAIWARLGLAPHHPTPPPPDDRRHRRRRVLHCLLDFVCDTSFCRMPGFTSRSKCLAVVTPMAALAHARDHGSANHGTATRMLDETIDSTHSPDRQARFLAEPCSSPQSLHHRIPSPSPGPSSSTSALATSCRNRCVPSDCGTSSQRSTSESSSA